MNGVLSFKLLKCLAQGEYTDDNVIFYPSEPNLRYDVVFVRRNDDVYLTRYYIGEDFNSEVVGKCTVTVTDESYDLVVSNVVFVCNEQDVVISCLAMLRQVWGSLFHRRDDEIALSERAIKFNVPTGEVVLHKALEGVADKLVGRYDKGTKILYFK